MEKAYKYCIYPNKKQKEILAKTFGCCRFVSNHYLAKRIKMYGESKETFSYIQCARLQEHIASQRKDFLQKLSTNIMKSKDLIVIEDL